MSAVVAYDRCTRTIPYDLNRRHPMAGFAAVVYTIGTALRRAQDEGMAVEILVGGEWLVGQVSASDGQGVMLRGENGGLSIVRLAGVDAVRVSDAVAFEGRSRDDL